MWVPPPTTTHTGDPEADQVTDRSGMASPVDGDQNKLILKLASVQKSAETFRESCEISPSHNFDHAPLKKEEKAAPQAPKTNTGGTNKGSTWAPFSDCWLCGLVGLGWLVGWLVVWAGWLGWVGWLVVLVARVGLFSENQPTNQPTNSLQQMMCVRVLRLMVAGFKV